MFIVSQPDNSPAFVQLGDSKSVLLKLDILVPQADPVARPVQDPGYRPVRQSKVVTPPLAHRSSRERAS